MKYVKTYKYFESNTDDFLINKLSDICLNKLGFNKSGSLYILNLSKIFMGFIVQEHY